jgi:hypothetical protein
MYKALLVLGLCNDSFTSSDYVVLYDGMFVS